MAGDAKTNAFMLATATVMVGPTNKLFDLNPAEHSIGLVKNFQVQADPSYVELTQGVKNTLVYSVLNANPVKCTMEVYEYTAKNLAYGLGLDGSTLDTIATNHTVKTQIVGDGATTHTVAIDSATDISSEFPVGSWVILQEVGGTDLVFVAKVQSVAYATLVLTITLDRDVPTGMTFDVGSLISKTYRINVGSRADQPFLAAKIVGIMPQGNEPIVLLVPKMRVTKGFSVAFHTDQFGNMPFEFSPYDLVSSDPNFADFNGTGPVAIFDRF
jgi:hypothetical protein